MRKIVFWIVPLAALCACETSPIGQPSAYDGLVRSYYSCVFRQADRYAVTSNEDAYYLALAAKDACSPERASAQQALFASESPSSRVRMWRVVDDIDAQVTARITRKRAG